MTKRYTGWVVLLIVCLFVMVHAGYASAATKGAQEQKPAKAAAANKGTEAAPSKEPATAAKPSTDGKVAVVNDTVIKKDMLDTEVVRFEKQMAMSGQAPDPAKTAEVQKKVLNDLIDREVLNQESRRLGVSIDDAEVDKQIAALKQKFPSEEEFTSALGKMNITEADLKVQYRQGVGHSKDDRPGGSEQDRHLPGADPEILR